MITYISVTVSMQSILPFTMVFWCNILGQKCLVMHSHKKAEDSCVLELFKIRQFESAALEMMMREQGLNTPAASIQIP